MKIKDEAIGGLSAGIVGTIIGYPLDLIKTRMQLGKTNQYGISSLAIQIIKNEGFFALYKGMIPPLLSLSILNTVNFTSYSHFRTIYGANHGWDIKNGLAGATAGPLASSISTVEHMLKTQMQLDNISGKRYKGSVHCFQSLIQSHGISILYTGHLVNTVREGVFLSSYFFIYEGIKELLIHSSTNKQQTQQHQLLSPVLAIPFAGGISGAMAWFISFPLDCVKAGIQGQQVEKDGHYRKKTAKDVTINLLKSKGIRGLYSGVTPSIVRAFLVSGSRFSAYEFALWLLRNNHDGR